MNWINNATDEVIQECYEAQYAALAEAHELTVTLDGIYALTPFYESVPLVVLNLAVLGSIAAIFTGSSRNQGYEKVNTERPAFLFIANLSFADLVTGFVIIRTVLIREQLKVTR